MHLLISFLLVAAGNAQRNKIYVNEGVQNVEIPCQIPKNVLYNPESKIKWTFNQMDHKNGSWINGVKTIEDNQGVEDEFFEIGEQKQLILKGIVTSENIGQYRCQAWSDRISFSSHVILILYSPPEEKQRFPEIFAKSRSTHFAKDRSSSLAMCISGIARPVPKIYWEVLDENGKLVSTLRPSTGPYSQNPPKIKSFDQSFYHEIALELMPEHGLSVSFDKMSFRCVVEYISGAGEDVETLRYTKNYPTKGGIRIYHAVTEVQAFYNGADMSGKTITVVADQTVTIYCRGNGFPAASFDKEKIIVNAYSGVDVVSCSGRNAINEEIDEYPPSAIVRIEYAKLEPVVAVDRGSASLPTLFKCKYNTDVVLDGGIVNIAWFSGDTLVSVKNEFRYDAQLMSDYTSLQCSVTVSIMHEDFTEMSPHFPMAEFQQLRRIHETTKTMKIAHESTFVDEELPSKPEVNGASTGSLIGISAVSAAIFGASAALVTQYVLKARAETGSSSTSQDEALTTTQDPQLNLRDHAPSQNSRAEKESYRAAIYNI